MEERKHPTVSIEYHADDFALFPTQSRRILDCHTGGRLNGISIMPNSPHLAECLRLLEPYRDAIAVTVHLNLFEGRSLCPREEIPALTDSQGNLSCSFGSLLLHSYLPGRNAYRAQLKEELRAQIQAVQSQLPEQPLRLDGHAHYHMVPVVFDALMDVIREDRLRVSYIRIPREFPSIYLKNRKQLRHLSPINFIKVLILNCLARRNAARYPKELAAMEQKLFMGVFLSGRMYKENVMPCLADAIRIAQEKKWGIELLAHPGGVYEPEDIACLTNASDVHFLTSDCRSREATLFEPACELQML